MKRLLAMSFIIVLVASAGACSKGKQSPNPSASATATAETPMEKTQVTIGLWGLEQPVAGQPSGKIRDYFADLYGVEFVVWPVTEQDRTEKIAAAAAGNSLPDLFVHEIFNDGIQLKNLIDGELIRDIPEDIYKNYHNLGTVLYRYKNSDSIDGKMWFVPRTEMSGRYDNGQSVAIWYRLDWALESGAITAGQAPVWQDFMNLLSYYSRCDLDANDCDDTWALTSSGEGLGGIHTAFFMPFGVRDWVLEDGSWVPGVISQRAKDALKWANQAFRSGFIDPDCIGQDEVAAMEKFCLGKAGILVADASPAGAARLSAMLQDKQPALDMRKAVSVLPQPMNPWGVAYNEDRSYSTGVLFSATVDDKKLNKILSLMDWLMGEDGLTYVNWGLKGVDYNVTGDGLQTLHRDDKGLPVTFGQMNGQWGDMAALATWGRDFMPAAGADDYRWKYLDTLENYWWANNWRRPMFTRYILDPAVQSFNADGRAEAALAELIMRSTDVEADWQAYVSSMKTELNVDAVAQIVNEYARQNNITTEE